LSPSGGGADGASTTPSGSAGGGGAGGSSASAAAAPTSERRSRRADDGTGDALPDPGSWRRGGLERQVSEQANDPLPAALTGPSAGATGAAAEDLEPVATVRGVAKAASDSCDGDGGDAASQKPRGRRRSSGVVQSTLPASDGRRGVFPEDPLAPPRKESAEDEDDEDDDVDADYAVAAADGEVRAPLIIPCRCHLGRWLARIAGAPPQEECRHGRRQLVLQPGGALGAPPRSVGVVCDEDCPHARVRYALLVEAAAGRRRGAGPGRRSLGRRLPGPRRGPPAGGDRGARGPAVRRRCGLQLAIRRKGLAAVGAAAAAESAEAQ